MNIPADLLTQVREGKVVLFFGSGASKEAKDASGRRCPTTQQLAELLSDKFLGGHMRNEQLSQVAELAISERDLGSVQKFLADTFSPLLPTDAHKMLPKFVWHGLATTNYDLLIENAYAQTPDRLQDPRPMIEDSDRVDDHLRDRRNVLLLKLHGCITRIASPTCPLILTTDQYLEHRRQRSRLFNTFKEWAAERPIVFIGQSVQDIDIREALLELQELAAYRPRYYIVGPDADDMKARFWESKRITLIKGTFEDFLQALDANIPPPFRSLAGFGAPSAKHPIQQFFRTNASVTKSTLQFLDVDVEYVNGITAVAGIEPKEFYKGNTGDFGAVEQNLDVRRHLTEEIALKYLIRDQDIRTAGPEVVLVKAHAGAGKSVILRRLAWDGSRDFDCVCLLAKPQGALAAGPLQELIQSLRRRVYLFVDDAVDRAREISSILKHIGSEGELLTIILAERINEWNVQGQELAAYVSEEYELKYLNSAEIDGLLILLERHHALGDHLERLSLEERRKELSEKAGRQLLVALHEATLGVPFETILLDEFKHIRPPEAQRLYTTVCVLNRLSVPVRAGLIARIHGIPFEYFKTHFFAPLEHVVFAQMDEFTRDYQYRARHPHIADVVFLKVLKTTEDRFDCYIRCLKALNIAYSVDWKAFWQMVRARNLLDLFPDNDMVQAIFSAAKENVGEDAHLLHQMGVYEMNRPGGDLNHASKLLARALELAPYDATIRHSIAEQKVKSADRSKTALEKTKLLDDAANIAAGLIRGEKSDSYARHTLVKVEIRELEDAIASRAPESEIAFRLKDAESALFDAQQAFPGDSYLLEAEANLARLLNDSERALTALKKAFEANPKNASVAIRLARQFEVGGRVDRAKDVLKKALDANGTDRRLHFSFAKLLMTASPLDGDLIAYHLMRSFSDGDSNYEARLLYGRQLFLNGRSDESRGVFRSLASVHLPPEVKNRLLYPIADRRFEGRMSRPQGNYAFITRDGQGDSIYVHSSNVDEGTWNSLTMGTRVRFSIAFSMRGPNAADVETV